jgi:hypothetical protein
MDLFSLEISHNGYKTLNYQFFISFNMQTFLCDKLDTRTICIRVLHPHRFCPRMIGPHMLQTNVFTSPYVSSLKELGCSKRPFPYLYVLVHFIPKEKGVISNFCSLNFFFIRKAQKHLGTFKDWLYSICWAISLN